MMSILTVFRKLFVAAYLKRLAIFCKVDDGGHHGIIGQSGRTIGERGAALEEGYFNKINRKKLEEIKEKLKKEKKDAISETEEGKKRT